MQCCLEGTDPVYNLLANASVRHEEVRHLIAYITMNNHMQQLYCVDRALEM